MSNSPEPARWRHIVSAVLAISCLVRAFDRRWVSDDAFISFRYGRHLAEGEGLVWNPGEYVEGYTNLLWTLVLAVIEKLEADPVLASQALGLASLSVRPLRRLVVRA
jgi:arabinofuranosyltransferase